MKEHIDGNYFYDKKKDKWYIVIEVLQGRFRFREIVDKERK